MVMKKVGWGVAREVRDFAREHVSLKLKASWGYLESRLACKGLS